MSLFMAGLVQIGGDKFQCNESKGAKLQCKPFERGGAKFQWSTQGAVKHFLV